MNKLPKLMGTRPILHGLHCCGQSCNLLPFHFNESTCTPTGVTRVSSVGMNEQLEIVTTRWISSWQSVAGLAVTTLTHTVCVGVGVLLTAKA